MPRQFFQTTAESTIRVIEAVHVFGNADIAAIELFCDLSNNQTVQALGLAADLGLISEVGGIYSASSPLAKFYSTPSDPRKASLLRITLESYDVFITFRERLFATGSADSASHQTKTVFELTNHREEIKETLISLGTYSRAISAEGGGQYSREEADISVHLNEVAQGCADATAAEQWVRSRLGAAADTVSRSDVLVPLSNALVKATSAQTDDAVTEAGNAFESYLAELASRLTLDLSGASGINSKLSKFRTDDKLPKKIVEASKYIGQIRNAAGHGIDTEVNASWTISSSTALDMVSVVCSMIHACHEHEVNGTFML